jgi:hypothetical protein
MAKTLAKEKGPAAKAAPRKAASAKAAAKPAAPQKNAKASKAPAGAAAAKGTKTAKKAVKKGDRYSCEVCGLIVSVDEACGCATACDIICCGAQMRAKG